MKTFFQKIFFRILLRRAKKVLRTPKIIIGITGSVGKTSTRMAIASVLAEKWRVQTSSQNFNTPIGLLLSILKIEESGSGVFSWAKIFLNATTKPLPHPQILVLEFGVDAPGDMTELLHVCTPSVAVMTPISLSHMSEGQFPDVAAIRTEKIQLAIAARKVIINGFDRETADFLRKIIPEKIESFGESHSDILEITKIQTENNGTSFLAGGEKYWIPVFGHFQAQIFAPAIILGLQNGLSPRQIQNAFSKILPPKGRGRIFSLKNRSTALDFSYNSSPKASQAVLKSLPEIEGFSRKIAVLGSMNELGKYASEEHQKLGKIAAEYADFLIFVGNFSEDFTRGVNGKKPLSCFSDSLSAVHFLQKELKENDLVLFKGSQNGVFLEEALARLLRNPKDAKNLCRQSANWKKKKEQFFALKKS